MNKWKMPVMYAVVFALLALANDALASASPEQVKPLPEGLPEGCLWASDMRHIVCPFHDGAIMSDERGRFPCRLDEGKFTWDSCDK